MCYPITCKNCGKTTWADAVNISLLSRLKYQRANGAHALKKKRNKLRVADSSGHYSAKTTG